MKIETVSTTTNVTVIAGIIVFIASIVLMTLTNLNLKNASPDTFYAVQIEGEPKIKEVIVTDTPAENPDAMRSWIKIVVANYFNYNANNYKQVIESGRENFTKSFYEAFAKATKERIFENVENGYYVSTAIVEKEPILIQQATIDGASYYKFYLRLTAIYKSELKTIITNPKIIVTVKFENPETNVRGIAISDLTITR